MFSGIPKKMCLELTLEMSKTALYPTSEKMQVDKSMSKLPPPADSGPVTPAGNPKVQQALLGFLCPFVVTHEYQTLRHPTPFFPREWKMVLPVFPEAGRQSYEN